MPVLDETVHGPLYEMWLDMAGLVAGKVHDPVAHAMIPFSRGFTDINNAFINAEKFGIPEGEQESFYHKQFDECVALFLKSEVWEMVEVVVTEIKSQLVRKRFPGKLTVTKATMQKILSPYEGAALKVATGKQGLIRKLQPHIIWPD